MYFYREYPLNPFKSANDELNDLKSELMEAVEQILNEYYKDFVSRKKKILSLQKLCDHTRYNLIVEKKHQLRL